MGQGCLLVLRFTAVSIIRPTPHTRIHLPAILNQKDERGNPANLYKPWPFENPGTLNMKVLSLAKPGNPWKSVMLFRICKIRTITLVLRFRRVRKIATHYIASSCLSDCPTAWNNSTSTGRIFMKFDIWRFFENMSLKSDRNNGHFTLRLRTFMISYSVLLKLRYVSDKSCGGNKNTFYVQ
jgi:hypothetical protein